MSLVDLRSASTETRRVPPRIPRDVIELIRQMIIDGKSHDDIKAACLERGRLVSDGPIYQQRIILREMGVVLPEGKPAGRPITEAGQLVREHGPALRDQGYSYASIGQRFGLSGEQVRSILASAGNSEK